MFTADTGAYGIKAVATLRLVQAPKSTAYMSFRFETLAECLEAQVEIARLSICSDAMALTPTTTTGLRSRASRLRRACRLSARSPAKEV